MLDPAFKDTQVYPLGLGPYLKDSKAYPLDPAFKDTQVYPLGLGLNNGFNPGYVIKTNTKPSAMSMAIRTTIVTFLERKELRPNSLANCASASVRSLRAPSGKRGM